MDLISDSLHYLGKNLKNAKALQIGAMDGINFDDTRGFFDMYSWKSILVEPVPEIFEELKENLKYRKDTVFENVAIGETEGILKMVTIPNQAIIDNNLHPGYKGMSAVYPLKNGFGSDFQRDIDVREKFGVDIEVPCTTVDKLLEKHNFEKVDIIICDAEGYDWQILKTIDLQKYDVKFLRLEYINLTDQEKIDIQKHLEDNGYVVDIRSDIDAVRKDIHEKVYPSDSIKSEYGLDSNVTIVSGLWDISREGRDFNSHYLPRFREFLEIPLPMVLFLPEELHEEVWKVRSKENTQVVKYELENLKNLYAPFWDKTQEIRNNPEWYNITGEGGWLKNSPQASLEWYNPIVQSKMFMLSDASIWNHFNTDYIFWLDAGITNTVPKGHLVEENVLKDLPKYGNPFLFLSYPYENPTEVHGFEKKPLDQLAGSEVKYVCRGGLFGGHKDQIRDTSSTYYGLLNQTLARGLMGTEETLFSILAHNEPNIYRRFSLDGNGLIVKFTGELLNNTVELVEAPKLSSREVKRITDRDIANYKTNLYILTFNFPDQVQHTINTMEKTPDWLNKPHLVLLDNSTDQEAKVKNQEIASKYNFEYIDLGSNTGICGGRQAAAEHFDASDADFMFFFEDDMTCNSEEEEGKFCRNGFRKYIPNLYNIVHKIMLREEFDFLKLSFTEVYMDNNIQVSWYNIPQHIRTRDFPEYDKLPVNGLDPNAPRTIFNNIDVMDGVSYASGDVYYANWPMIVSKEGNRKMFIETKWGHPYEQTWMSHMYQETKLDNLKPAVLLASPIWHDRILYYKPEERREN